LKAIPAQGKYLSFQEITLDVTQLRRYLKAPLYRNSLFLIANTVFTTGLGFFFWMVVARFYTAYEVGVGSAIISAVYFLALLSIPGLDVAIVRFLPKSQKPVELINSCLTLSGILALVVGGIFLAGLGLWSPKLIFVRERAVFTIAFLVFAFGWTLSNLIGSVFIAKRRAEFNLAKNTILSLLKIPLPILMVLFFHAFGIVSSWGVATGIAVAICLFYFLPRVQKSYKPVPHLNLNIIKNIWKYSTGNYFASILAATPSFILPIMIVNILSGEQNAYFYVAWTIAVIPFSIPGAASTSLFAEGSHFEDELGTYARRALRFALVLLIPTIILLVVLGKWLLLAFGSSYSSNALTLLWILGASSIFVGINSVYYTILLVRRRIRELLVLRGLLALAVLVASAFAMRAIGIVGIGYAWLGAQALVSIYVALTIRWRYRVRPV
jgi:O-antigen/teichoic acid export membrane protein